MRSPIARWTLLSKSSTTPRSSHCLSISKEGLIAVYGGELKPRTPTDSGEALNGSVHVFDLKSSSGSGPARQDGGANVVKFFTLSSRLQNSASGAVPKPRVGASTVSFGDSLYLWGGRGGVDMFPLSHPESAGPWRATFNGTIQGSAADIRWERLRAINEDEAPEPRSYHVSVVYNGNMYIHAGCPTSGRLATLHSFDLKSLVWKQLADAPGPGRGGTALAVCALPKYQSQLQDHVVFVRFGGFAGYELPTSKDTGEGSIDIYTPESDRWNTVTPEPDPTHGHPGPRSVHGLVPFATSHAFTDTSDPTSPTPIAIMYHGERDASSLGHAGAGTFWDDVWVLFYDAQHEVWMWRKADVGVEGGAGEGPEARGWFPSGAWADGEAVLVVMQGGLVGSNERLGDAWVMRVSI